MFTIALLLLLLLTFFLIYFLPLLNRCPRPRLPSLSPPLLPYSIHPYISLPYIGPPSFFVSRADFVLSGTRGSPTGNFSFFFGPYHVIALSGPAGRKVHYHDKRLSFLDGYSALFTGIPPHHDDGDEALDKWLRRMLGVLLKSGNLGRWVGGLAGVARGQLTSLSLSEKGGGGGEEKEGVMDPFDVIYRLVYRLTVPTFGAVEITRSEGLLRKTLRMFNHIEEGASPTRIVVPGLPTWAWARRILAGVRFGMVVDGIVKDRKKTGRREDDGLQVLLDNGETEMTRLVAFVLAGLFGGQTNTGVSAAMLLVFLAASPKWQSRVRKEVDAAVRANRKSKEQTDTEVLASMTLTEWEVSFPTIEMCSRETIRHHLVGVGFRRNVSNESVPLDTGEVIPPGAVVLLSIDDTHFDPEFYPDPEKWDPSRFEPEMQEKAPSLPFAGWGAGKHPCLGMRFAKLEVTIITAMFVALYDFILEDIHGNRLASAPPVDRNDHQTSKPKTPLRIRYRLRKTPTSPW